MFADTVLERDLIASFRLPYQRTHEDVMVKSYDAPKSSVFYLLLNPVILGSLDVFIRLWGIEQQYILVSSSEATFWSFGRPTAPSAIPV